MHGMNENEARKKTDDLIFVRECKRSLKGKNSDDVGSAGKCVHVKSGFLNLKIDEPVRRIFAVCFVF